MPGVSSLVGFGFLAAAVVLAVWVLARPHKKPYTLGLLSLFLLLIGLAVAGSAVWVRPPAMLLPLLLAALVLMPVWVIARGFGRVDLMAIAIHAALGMKGGTLKGYENEILSSLVVVSVATLGIWGLHALTDTGPWVLGAGTLVLVALNPLVRDGVGRLLRPRVRAELSARLLPPSPLTRPETLPDIVVIYLEGTDRRFLDTGTFGDLAAPLRQMEAESLSLTGIGQAAGTGWSLAGMVASLAGVPVLPHGLRGHNKLGGVARFMPEVQALGDVLRPHGYAMEYIVGGDPRFAGLDAFYLTHGIGVIGRDEQIAMHPDDHVVAARIDRVLDDQMTFDSARLRHAALSESGAPLLLVVETIGPHGRSGYLSRRATPDGNGTKSKDWRAVVGSLVDETMAFVADLRAAHARLRGERPLRLVILSDHLSHNVNLPRCKPEFAGRNLALLVGGEVGRIDRAGAMFDVYPTLLEWLGFAGPGAVGNLGRSLLSPGPTLVEEYGAETLDRMLTADAALAARLWSGASEP